MDTDESDNSTTVCSFKIKDLSVLLIFILKKVIKAYLIAACSSFSGFDVMSVLQSRGGGVGDRK